MATTVNPNEYGFRVVQKGQQYIPVTNSTARDLLAGEIAVVQDSNNLAFIGVVDEPEGIAASGGTGNIDLNESNVIQTNQVADSQTFVAGNTKVYIAIQSDSSEALIYAASASGRFPLNAYISRVASDNSWIEIRMPAQDGTIEVAS